MKNPIYYCGRLQEHVLNMSHVTLPGNLEKLDPMKLNVFFDFRWNLLLISGAAVVQLEHIEMGQGKDSVHISTELTFWMLVEWTPVHLWRTLLCSCILTIWSHNCEYFDILYSPLFSRPHNFRDSRFCNESANIIGSEFEESIKKMNTTNPILDQKQWK